MTTTLYKADASSDYIACIFAGAAGSWQRNSDMLAAMNEVKKRFKSDFGGLFKIGKDDPVIINIWRVNGDKFSIGSDGVFGHEETDTSEFLFAIETTY